MQTAPVSPAPPDPEVSIRQTLMDYYEGRFEGDAERVQSALRPEMIQRGIALWSKTNDFFFPGVFASNLVEDARAGITKRPPGQRELEILILDVSRRSAVARVETSTCIDYVNLAKIHDEWKIMLIFFENKGP
jgi:hypothetical protein